MARSNPKARLRLSKYLDRKSTRLNSSHSQISYAVFCLKKKIRKRHTTRRADAVHRAHEPSDRSPLNHLAAHEVGLLLQVVKLDSCPVGVCRARWHVHLV